MPTLHADAAFLYCLITLSLASIALGQTAPAAARNSSPPEHSFQDSYALLPGDTVQVSVYQEDDMGAKARVEKDGTVLLPLLGKVEIAGKTLEQACKAINDLLLMGYLVNPQVSVTILEYGKRRVTILGQVQRPGTYEVANDEPIDLLRAVAMAGGYTRIGSPGKVTVQRRSGDQTKTFKLDAGAMSNGKSATRFQIEPDDTITVGEKLF